MPRGLSSRQKIAITGVIEGKQMSEALREAGYSEKTIDNPRKNFLGSPLVQAALQDYPQALVRQGVNSEWLAEKTIKLFESKDVRERLKGHDLIRQDLGIGQAKPNNQNLTQNNIVMDSKTAKEITEAIRQKLGSTKPIIE